MPVIWNPGETATTIIGLLALVAGTALYGRSRLLRRLNIPAAVIGGLAVSAATLALYAAAGTEVKFADGLRDLLLLVFFSTIGLSARLKALREGGGPLALLCLSVVVLLVLQNAAGMLVMAAFGEHPFYGLLLGSASFMGGPGTAMAWAREGQVSFGLERAPEIGLAAATVAVLSGALVSGPIAGRLVERKGLGRPSFDGGAVALPGAGGAAPDPVRGPAVQQALQALLLVALALGAGDVLNVWARAQGQVLPGFLTAMLAGVAISNALDLARWRIPMEGVEHAGEIALQVFLVLSLMSLRLWSVGGVILPMLVNAAVQVALSVLVAVFVLFRLLGRNYDAAVTAGGFLGFGLSSMPVAMATMEQLAARYGPSPRAFLLITLCGSVFVDLSNALIIKAFLALPVFATAGG
jgi:ESS family glutamate:Na+ symporter